MGTSLHDLIAVINPLYSTYPQVSDLNISIVLHLKSDKLKESDGES